MRISLNWLKDFIVFDPKKSIEDIAWRLTESTAAIEMIHDQGKSLSSVVVGEIKEIKKHPQADKLHVAKVQISPKETIQLIFGQVAGVSVGDKVPTALAPCELSGGKIEAKEIRGVFSEGMLCLDSELFDGGEDILTKFPAKTSIGSPVAPLMELDDIVLEVDNHSLTHRSDLFSHLGFARECVALSLATWKTRKQKKIRLGKKALPIKVQFENKTLSKSYWGTVIRGVSAKPSPQWLQRRLQSVGIRSINAMVDITNYVMMELGQPTHAFDPRFLQGQDFLLRLSRAGEKVKTLDGVERTLPAQVIVVESGGKIIDLAGIMGGENSEIKSDTKEIYFHSAQFDHVLIRRAMIALGHRTDGGTMHEKNIEAERSGEGFFRGLELFHQIFPEAHFDFQLFSALHQQSPKRSVRLPLEKFEKHTGISISLKEAKQILKNLGFQVKATKTDMVASVPPFRSASVMIPEDLIEEIVRIHGYSNVPAAPPIVGMVPPTRHHKTEVRKTLEKVLISQGFLEEVNFAFLSEGLHKKISTDMSSLLEIRNPVNEDLQYMRGSLIPYLLKNLSRNELSERRIWKTFEIGKIFERREEEVQEMMMLTAVTSSSEPERSFYLMKGLVESLFSELSLPLIFEGSDDSRAFPGRILEMQSDGKIVGKLFELHPFVKENFELQGSVSVLEIPLANLEFVKPRDIQYQEINRLPPAYLDLSVLVSETTKVNDMETLIRSAEPELLKIVKLLEVYRGKNLPEGKKSFTYSLVLQHPQRTLSESEIQDVLNRMITKVEAAGAVVRR